MAHFAGTWVPWDPPEDLVAWLRQLAVSATGERYVDPEGTTGPLVSRDTPAGPVVTLEGGRLELTGLDTMRRTGKSGRSVLYDREV